MRKVNLQAIKSWITNKVIELVGFKDEVIIDYTMGLLEDESKPVGCNAVLLSDKLGTYSIADS